MVSLIPPQAASVTPERKREALRRMLDTRAFERSEQLRKLLIYLCEAEIAGRTHEVDEYRLGTEVLGRSSDFSPTEESIVRNRTHALRRKLEEAYGTDLAGETLRISLPKGTYVPTFVEIKPPSSPGLGETPNEPALWTPRRLWLGAGLAVLLLAIAISLVALFNRGNDGVDPVLAEFWGPLLDPNSNVTLLLAAPAQLLLRDYPVHAPPSQTLEPSAEVRGWYLREVGPRPDGDLRLLRPAHSPLYGDSLAAVRVAQTLGMAGVGPELLSESVIRPSALRDRNVVIVGRPDYSDYVGTLMDSAPLNVEYDPDTGIYIVKDRKQGTTKFVPRSSASNEDYALITVFDSDVGHGRHRTIIFSGTVSTTAEAAVEFFSSPVRLRDLRRRMPTPLPKRYQVVVCVHMASQFVLASDYSYAAHEVWPLPGTP